MRYLLLLVILACSYRMPPQKPEETPKPETRPEPPKTADNSPFLTVNACSNCTVEQFKRIQESVLKANEVVKGQCFSDFMLKRKLIQTNNKTNAEVVKTILDGGVVIDAEMYYSLKRVLGYMIIGQKKEWINSRYMMSWSACDLSSLLVHESLHHMGFMHDYSYSPSRDFSVNYSANAAVDTCCKGI